MVLTGDRFQPTDPTFLRDPYPIYARLQAETPIAFYPGWDAWIITRHADVAALLRDRRLGRTMHHLQRSDESPAADPARAPFDEIQAGSLLEIEPPDHTRVKQVVHAIFTPKHVRALRERIEGLVARQLDDIAARPERRFDLLRDFAEPIPVAVIAALLGVPVAERAPLLGWSKGIIGMFEPERTPAMERAAIGAAAAFAAYVRRLMVRKRALPGDDLITRMVQEHDRDPSQLTEGEIVANAILFLNAGHEAVVNVLGNGLRALLQHPQAVAALRADPALWAGAIEEMMRFDTPLQFFERRVLQELEFGGFRWPVGTKVVLYYAAANRDPAVFENPDRFDIHRHPNPHLAFGLGLHYCIGAPLARLELSISLAALFERFPSLALTGEPLHFEPKNVFRYLRAFPLRY